MGRLHALNPYFDHAKKSYGLLTVFEKLKFSSICGVSRGTFFQGIE